MRATATIFATCILALPTLSCAQTNRPASKAQSAQNRIVAQAPRQGKSAPVGQGPRRLETVTWNSVTRELTWVVSQGQTAGTGFQPLSSANYEIRMDNATMTFQGETRRFSRQEAVNVQALMDVVAKYAVDSTFWWEDGQGEKLDKDGNPVERPKRRNKDHDIDRPAGDSIAVLHVSFSKTPVPAQVPARADLRAEIERLEQRLADLKRWERTSNARRLESASY